MDYNEAFEMINRHKADVDRLDETIRTIRAEAIKEFAERVKEKAYEIKGAYDVVEVDTIDNLVKEMVGDDNA